MKTNILIEADITILNRAAGEEQELRVHNIPCTWVWEDVSRDVAEYWAVADWITEAFGNSIEWFSIGCVVGSPVKEAV
jgi:hypothetical protein